VARFWAGLVGCCEYRQPGARVVVSCVAENANFFFGKHMMPDRRLLSPVCRPWKRNEKPTCKPIGPADRSRWQDFGQGWLVAANTVSPTPGRW